MYSIMTMMLEEIVNIIVYEKVFFGTTAPIGRRPPHSRGFLDHTQ
jgi:hypothetical protein